MEITLYGQPLRQEPLIDLQGLLRGEYRASSPIKRSKAFTDLGEAVWAAAREMDPYADIRGMETPGSPLDWIILITTSDFTIYLRTIKYRNGKAKPENYLVSFEIEGEDPFIRQCLGRMVAQLGREPYEGIDWAALKRDRGLEPEGVIGAWRSVLAAGDGKKGQKMRKLKVPKAEAKTPGAAKPAAGRPIMPASDRVPGLHTPHDRPPRPQPAAPAKAPVKASMDPMKQGLSLTDRLKSAAETASPASGEQRDDPRVRELASLPSISPSMAIHLVGLGVDSITQLANINLNLLKGVPGMTRDLAKALREEARRAIQAPGASSVPPNVAELAGLPSVGEVNAHHLVALGVDDIEKLANVNLNLLKAIPGMTKARAKAMREEARTAIGRSPVPESPSQAQVPPASSESKAERAQKTVPSAVPSDEEVAALVGKTIKPRPAAMVAAESGTAPQAARKSPTTASPVRIDLKGEPLPDFDDLIQFPTLRSLRKWCRAHGYEPKGQTRAEVVSEIRAASTGRMAWSEKEGRWVPVTGSAGYAADVEASDSMDSSIEAEMRSLAEEIGVRIDDVAHEVRKLEAWKADHAQVKAELTQIATAEDLTPEPVPKPPLKAPEAWARAQADIQTQMRALAAEGAGTAAQETDDAEPIAAEPVPEEAHLAPAEEGGPTAEALLEAELSEDESSLAGPTSADGVSRAEAPVKETETVKVPTVEPTVTAAAPEKEPVLAAAPAEAPADRAAEGAEGRTVPVEVPAAALHEAPGHLRGSP